MIAIKAFTRKQYYLSKYGEKQYLDGGDSDNTLMMAALLTGKGLSSDEECIYTAYGETEEEAMKSLENYKSANPDHPTISRIENQQL